MKHTKIYYLHKGDNIPFYIGKSNTPSNRIFFHRSRFGLDTILEELDSVPLTEWKFWECYWIGQFKDWGYILQNKNKGGNGSDINPNFPPDRGKKISKSLTGKKMAHKGRPLSGEHKQKIKDTRQFLKTREITWLQTPVLQYDLEGNFIKEFGSLKEAQYIMGKPNTSGISAVCNGLQKTAYGYKWKFKNK